MPITSYRYEARRGDQIIAAGHITQETALEVGDRIASGRNHGTVREIEATLADGELRLTVQLDP